MSLCGTQRHTSKYHTQGRFLGHLCSRFLARFDSTRDGLEQLQSRCLGCHTSQTNTDTPPRRYGESGEYSPRGGRFVTAAYDPVRVWDSNDSHLLVDIKVHTITPDYNSGLLWFNNHLFVASNTTIKELDASTRSVVSEWPVPESDETSCIALPQHGEFIAYSTQSTVTF